MAEERVQRRLAAILAADVVGYSRLIGNDEAGTRARFNGLLDAVVRPAIDEHRGRLANTMGDGFLVEFGSVVDAVQCATDIQNAVVLRERSEPDDRKMLLRMGIHLGDVIVESEDIHGDGVNIAARLEGLAEEGGICISDMVRAGIMKKIDIELADLGEQPLKNIAEPVHVYRVELAGPAGGTDDGAGSNAMFRRPTVAVLPFENLSGDPEATFRTNRRPNSRRSHFRHDIVHWELTKARQPRIPLYSHNLSIRLRIACAYISLGLFSQ